MTNHESGNTDGIRELADMITTAGVTGLRYRDFIARKAARVFMDGIGLGLENDDVGNAALEDVLGTGVATGMVLSATGKTTPEDVDEQTARLAGQMPDPLREPLGAMMPHVIRHGIDFHRDEMMPGSARIEAWAAEFRLFKDADPRHELWGE